MTVAFAVLCVLIALAALGLALCVIARRIAARTGRNVERMSPEERYRLQSDMRKAQF